MEVPQPPTLFRFEDIISPTVVKFGYFLGLAVIGVAVLFQFLAAIDLMTTNFGFGFGRLAAVLIGGAFVVIAWRVICEVWLMLFRIYDHLPEEALRSRES